MIQLVRKEAMPAAVPREKINPPAVNFAADDCIRRRAKRRLDRVLLRIGESFDLVKAASADDADGCIF